MHRDVAEISRHVVPAERETHLWVRYEVCEHHHGVGQPDNGALVEDFHLCGVVGLEGPHVPIVDDYGGRDSNLNGNLGPEEPAEE